MSNEKHTAIYVRVSTAGQDHASQLPELKRWAESHDGTIKWYKDKFTGKTMDRPAMSKMMGALNNGKLTLQRHISSRDRVARADEVFQVAVIGGLTAWTPGRSGSWVGG